MEKNIQGIFDKAKNGIVYLKEITELPKISQNKLLNILAMNSYKRCGGDAEIPFESRIISEAVLALILCWKKV